MLGPEAQRRVVGGDRSVGPRAFVVLGGAAREGERECREGQPPWAHAGDDGM
jgi:hypothetical protein